MTTCFHGHAGGCGCGDCAFARATVARRACGRHDVPVLREPRDRGLIACQIQTGPGMTWTDRTYALVRATDGQWMVDFGEGGLEPRRSWEAVLDWLRSLRPRDVELLEAP